MFFENFDYSKAKVSFENSKEKTTKANNTEQLKENLKNFFYELKQF